MSFKITAIKNCDVDCKNFRYWVLFSFLGNKSSKRKTNKKIREFLSSLLGPEHTRWQLQGAGEQYILKLRDQKDYTFFLLKIPRD